MTRFWRFLDASLLLAALLACSYMVVREPVRGVYELVPHGLAGVWRLLPVVALAGIGLLFTMQSPRRLSRLLLRPPLYGLVALLVAMALARWTLSTVDESEPGARHWPPRVSENREGQFDQLSATDRAEWAAKVAMHRVTTTSLVADTAAAISVPRTWDFPDDVAIAVRSRPAVLEVWARTPDGTLACSSQPAKTPLRECAATSVAPPASEFRAIQRVDEPPPPVLAPATTGAWRQYRGDGQHDAITIANATTTTAGRDSLADWQVKVDGAIRASASVSGDIVLIGAHGTGDVQALTISTGRSRWRSRVPSWVHMDIVTDGRAAIVGFGDNMLSFVGRAPSGVASYNVETGQHLWTRFDESSVMTSPVLHDSTLVYATSVGVLRKRLMSTGAVIAQDTLPGGAVMAPPAMHGDTVLFNLEADHSCAVLFSTLRRLWCRQFPNMRLMGHAAPTIANGLAIVSGATTLGANSLSELTHLPRSVLARAVKHALFPNEYEAITGQRFMAFRLADGEPVWRSPLYSDVRLVDGHVAGSAVVQDSNAVIILPISNVVIGFDPQSGAIRWTAEGHGSRGPPLLLDGRVIVSGRDGITTVRSIRSGAVECTMTRQDGYDRAGPAVVRGRLIFASMKGTLESLSADALLHCTGAGMSLPSHP